MRPRGGAGSADAITFTTNSCARLEAARAALDIQPAVSPTLDLHTTYTTRTKRLYPQIKEMSKLTTDLFESLNTRK